MYINNGKISNRQTFRLYVFDLIGIATLLLPPYLAKICGVSGLWSILLGTGLGMIYLLYLGWIMKKMQTDICTYLRENVSKGIRIIALGIVWAHSVLTAGFCAYVFSNLMQYTLVRESVYWVVLLVIVLVSVYAVSGGIESRARVYEVLFWLVLVPFTGMLFAAIKNFELAYTEGIFSGVDKQVLKGSYLVFLFLTPLFFSLFLIGEKEKNYGRNVVKTIMYSIIVSAALLFFSFLLLIGNFGDKSLATMRFPIVTIMSTIQFKGNFLKRMDAFMLGVWFFTLYALLNLHLHYGVRLLQEFTTSSYHIKKDDVIGDNDRENNNAEKVHDGKRKVKWWCLCIPAGLVFFIAYAMQQNRNLLSVFFLYYAYIAVPIMVVLPVILVLVRSRKRETERSKK